MSEEIQPAEQGTIKKPRKAAAPRAKKASKEAKAAPKAAKDTSGLPEVPQTPSEESRRAPVPVSEESVRVERRREIQEPQEAPQRSWPEIETIQGGSQPSTSGKRKRRRKKKGGQGAQVPVPAGSPEVSPRPSQSQPQREMQEDSEPAETPQARQQQAPRVRLDQEDLTQKAWKLFQSEVAEEGMALIGDQDARELSRKSFRLAEIFLEEQARRGR